MGQSILTNTGVATGGRMLTAGLGVVGTALLSRLLGPAGYGAYALLLSVGSVLLLVADFGLYLTLAREVAAHPAREWRLFWDVMGLRGVLLGLMMVLGVGAAAVVPSLAGLGGVLLLLLVGLALQSVSQLLMALFQHHRVVWRATLGDVIGRLVQIGLLAAALVAGWHSLELAVGAFVAATAVALVIHGWLAPLRRHDMAVEAGSEGTTRRQSWRRLLHVSAPLGALLLLNAIYFRVDIVMLSLWREPAEVGWYGIAYRVVETGLFFPAMFGGLLLPRITQAWVQRNRTRAAAYVDEGFRLLLVGALGLGGGLVLFGSDIIRLVAGSEFAPAGSLLGILAAALGMMFLGNLFGFAAVALGRARVLLGLYTVLIVVNVVSNWWAIPRWGAWGAAATTVLTESVAMLVAGYLVARWIGWRVPVGMAARAAAAAGAAGTAAWLLYGAVPLAVPAAVWIGGFAAAVWWWRVLGWRQVALLRET